MRAFYACTASHMEVMAVDEFLRKLNPRLSQYDSWIRIFPARRLSQPRPLRSDAEPARRPPVMNPVSGVTGEALIAALVQVLQYKQDECPDVEILVIIDDADCRFSPGGPCRASAEEDLAAALRGYCDTLTTRLRAALQRTLRVILLLAFPEGEAWLYADWSEGFGKEYPALQHPLRNRITADILRGTPVEEWGSWDAAKNSCASKFSQAIIDLFDAPPGQGGLFQKDAQTQTWTPVDPATLATAETRYSKAVNGARMLRRIRPAVIAEECRQTFRPGYQELQRACDAQEPT